MILYIFVGKAVPDILHINDRISQINASGTQHLMEATNCGTPPESHEQNLFYYWIEIVKNIEEWKAREDPESMVKLVEYWSPPLATLRFHQNLLELVLTKIQRQIEEWDPLTDTIPVHVWILPWLPLLASRFETTVFPILRNKLAAALQVWHVVYAKQILKLWQEVFSQEDMEIFRTHVIIPKVESALQQLVINPYEQNIDCWYWAMNWEDMLHPYTMAGLLEKYFFPKWLQILKDTIKYNPNIDEIRYWFHNWRDLVSENLRTQPTVKENFRLALELIDRADSSNSASSIPENGTVCHTPENIK